MKWFRLFLVSTISITLILMLYWSLDVNYIDPEANQNKYYSKLKHALIISNIEAGNFAYRDYVKEIEFRVKTDKGSLKVIFSTDKDPYFQVASLQKTIKAATIKGNEIKLVDLSISHPYATFQNN